MHNLCVRLTPKRICMLPDLVVGTRAAIARLPIELRANAYAQSELSEHVLIKGLNSPLVYLVFLFISDSILIVGYINDLNELLCILHEYYYYLLEYLPHMTCWQKCQVFILKQKLLKN